VQGGVGRERTVAFSDGVFAIAITLLVLSVDIPELPNESAEELSRALRGTWPHLLSYFIGFFVIGLFWVGHHRFFDSLRGYDERLMAANLLFLSLIALLPFPTAVLGEHDELTVSVVVFAAAVAAAGLAEALMLWLALDRNLLGADEQAHPRRYLGQSLITPAVFLASIPVAFVAPGVAPYTWLAMVVLRRGRFFRARAPRR
jgi:uncharacterized membrane protein